MEKSINKLTGDDTRLPRPALSIQERTLVRKLAKDSAGGRVAIYGREFWADPDGVVYCVAWESGDKHVSGDRI